MANNILNITDSVAEENIITNQQFHTYSPYSQSFENNDEVRITIQSDLIVLPSQSYLYIDFSAAKNDGAPFGEDEAIFAYNFTAHMFSEMRYELNGIEVDRNKSPGITTTMKCLLACKSEDERSYVVFNEFSTKSITAGKYRMVIPLRFLFGFCDDFRKVILKCKHELILVRSRTNERMYQANADILKLTINKIQWKMPHVTLSDSAKLMMLNIEKRNQKLNIPFRSWDLYELPSLPTTDRHSWTIKTTTQVRKPRYVIVAFQTNRNSVVNDSSEFDHCNISNIKLYLNNQRYPYDDLNLAITEKHFHELYYTMQNIQQTYYNEISFYNPVGYDLTSFAIRPLFGFDCTKSEENGKKGMVDVRLELESTRNFPANTTVYCLIIHDNLVQYSPFDGMVYREI